MKAFDKREGGGAHNWGTVKDDMNTKYSIVNFNPLTTDPLVNGPLKSLNLLLRIP